MKAEKPAILKYVKFWKKLFVVFSCIALPALMICLLFAAQRYIGFWFVSAGIAVLYLTVYGFYAVYISMGTVIGFETTEKVVYVTTKRKTYTYDVKRGCKSVKVTKRKFVCTFETQDSRDKFTFLRKVMFAKSYEDQFTAEEIASFYPAIVPSDAKRERL